MMKIVDIKRAAVAHPTGDKNFSVMQPFPSGITPEDADPFLMCDQFGPSLSKGKSIDPDDFPVKWHPHRGMDILTYLIEGVGRHADSLGNRGEYSSPGMQWISVGSGIEHAEGGGTPAGEYTTGFQIWVNVPSDKKMEDPRYGTEPPENIPILSFDGSTARLLAGEYDGFKGPFQTVQNVLIMDIVVTMEAELTLSIPETLDNCMIYAYKGSGVISGQSLSTHEIIRFDASEKCARNVTLNAVPANPKVCDEGQGPLLAVMVFAGTRLNQPIAWHGPFVMTTQEEIRQTLHEYRTGTFLVKRAAWDYKRIATAPRSALK